MDAFRSPRFSTGPQGLVALAEWITEDVLQHLYARRQDLADLAERSPQHGLLTETLRSQLLQVIRELRGLATALRAPDIRAVESAVIKDRCDAVDALLIAAEHGMADALRLLQRPPLRPRTAGRGPLPDRDRSIASPDVVAGSVTPVSSDPGGPTR